MLHNNITCITSSVYKRISGSKNQTTVCAVSINCQIYAMTITACLTDPDDIAILLRVDPGFQVFAPG